MSDLFLRIFTHLLPNARAWRLTIDKKLRQFFEGLTGFSSDIKDFFDLIFLDIFPETTREIDAWEESFGLPTTGLTEQERRDRLAATWQALGGQSPYYIQTTLQNAGFDVYVHEWWEPGTEPPTGTVSQVTPRNPLLYLRRETNDSAPPQGYPLVNKINRTVPDYLVLCGEAVAQAGEADAQCGYFEDFVERLKNYIIPNDPAYWPYFLYIGGQTFGDLAQVPSARRNEFENLCLKICPTQQWLGILVEYI